MIDVEGKQDVDEREIEIRDRRFCTYARTSVREIHLRTRIVLRSSPSSFRGKKRVIKLNKIIDKEEDEKRKKEKKKRKQSYRSLCWMNDEKAIYRVNEACVCREFVRNVNRGQTRKRKTNVSKRERASERERERERENERTCSANDKCVSYLCLVTNYVCIYVLYTHGHTRKKKKKEVHYIPHM